MCYTIMSSKYSIFAKIFSLQILLLFTCGFTYVDIVTSFEGDGRVTNTLVISVDKQFYTQEFFVNYKNSVKNMQVKVEEYEEEDKKGIRITESFDNISSFVAEYIQLSTDIYPRLLQVELFETPRLSNKLYQFQGQVDPTYFANWGEVAFTYFVLAPAEITSYNGTLLNEQSVVWRFTEQSERSLISAEWTQYKTSYLTWGIYGFIVIVNFLLLGLSFTYKDSSKKPQNTLIKVVIGFTLIYSISVIFSYYIIQNFLSYFSSDSLNIALLCSLFIVSVSMLIYNDTFKRIFAYRVQISNVSTTGLNYPLVAFRSTNTGQGNLEANNESIVQLHKVITNRADPQSN